MSIIAAWSRRFLILLVWSSIASVVQGGWGDYADTSFQCPALTTCDPVCVSSIEECPPDLQCNATESLCPNGRECVKNVTTDCPPPSREEEDDNPCQTMNLCNKNVTCLRTNLYLDDCIRRYDSFYNNATNCTKAKEMEKQEWISWTSPGHVFFYVWICIVTIVLLSWCSYNQRFAPIGQSVPLHDFTVATGRRRSSYTSLEGNTNTVWTQTGYKSTRVGDTIYVMVLLTLAGFHALLATLTAFYYAQQNGYGLFIDPPVYKSDVQVLMAFEITWLVAFVWTLSLKWPSSVRALFLRRCHLHEATHVAVFAPTSHTVRRNKDVSAQAPYIAVIKKATIAFFKHLDKFYAFIFSEVNRPNIPGKFHFKKVEKDKSFTFHLRRYNYDEVTETFMPGIILMGHSIEELMDRKNGLEDEDVVERQQIVGKNVIPMKKPTLIGLTLTEGSKIFYTYQIYIIWWWFNFWYWHMGLIYFGMFVLGGVTTVYVTYLNEQKLFKLGEVSGTAKALRNGEWVSVPQKELVPGDVIVVEAGQAHCDMVLLHANTVLVDESSITGEATPVAKTGVDMAAGCALYSSREHKKNTISAGTCILESDEKSTEAIALVTQTGSFTTKGNLLRDILFYERHKFKFDHEIVLVFAILIVYATFAFFLTVYFLSEDEVVYAIFYGMYVVETAIPPLIPTVFLVSVGVSAERLRRRRIATSDNREILVAGKVKMAFFDKTGTLTNQGLDFISSHYFAEGVATNSAETRKLMDRGMAACHTLAKTDQGVFIGTFIDEVMFKSTGATMSSATEGPAVIETKDGGKMKILKRFEFDHLTMSQSVLVEDETGRVYSFVKGSAESIKKICKGNSLPSNYTELSENASREGIYQIALATADAPPGEVLDSGEISYAFVSREEAEKDLTFVGFMDFKNTLRAETPNTLKQLKEGGVSTVMITGDSVFTGIHIARESGLIDEEANVILGRAVNLKRGTIVWVDGTTDEATTLPPVSELSDPENNLAIAVTGEVWQVLISKWTDEANELSPFISIYGRCTPDDKVSVVAHFVKRGMITMMTGDGGNDCGALRTAHVGVALSDSEASIVSPFTSLDKSIESVVEVLREGRCCLASAFSSYKFMILYGQLETILQITAAYFNVGFAEWNWVWLDGVLVVPLAFLLPMAKSARKLGPFRPTSSLLGPHTMASVIGILAINVTCLSIAFIVLNHQEWYLCRKWTSTDISLVIGLGDNYESSVVFIMTVSQFVFSGMAMNFGFSFRRNFFRNFLLVGFVALFLLVHFFILLVPGPVSCVFRMNCLNEYNYGGSVYEMGPVPLQNPYNMTLMPEDYRVFLAVLLACNMVLVLSWEFFIVGNGWGKCFCHGLRTFVWDKDEPMTADTLESLQMIKTAETEGSAKYERVSSKGLYDRPEAPSKHEASSKLEESERSEPKEEDP